MIHSLRREKIKLIRNFIVALFILCVPLTAATAQEQTCAPRENMIEQLGADYEEQARWYGVDQAVVIELLTNQDTGTWTILVSYADGRTCMVGDGNMSTFIIPLEGDPT